MPEKRTTAAGYAPSQVARVKSTCLYYGEGVSDVVGELRPLLLHASNRESTGILAG